MQITNFLIFPETEMDWEENVDWYISEGLYFEEQLHILFENPLMGVTITADDVSIGIFS